MDKFSGVSERAKRYLSRSPSKETPDSPETLPVRKQKPDGIKKAVPQPDQGSTNNFFSLLDWQDDNAGQEDAQAPRTEAQV